MNLKSGNKDAKKKVKYSCFVDNQSKFIYQAWQLINSLINNANVLPENICVFSTSL